MEDTLNPEFVQTIEVEYFFEEQQLFRLDIYDCDDANQLHILEKQDHIGSFEFKLGKVVGNRDQCLVGDIEPSQTIKKKFKDAQVTISGTEKKDGYGQV